MKNSIGSTAPQWRSSLFPGPSASFHLRIPAHWVEACIAALIVLSPLPGFSFVKIRIQPRIYIGVGLGRTLNAKPPAFSIEDQDDADYQALNLGSLQRNFARGQIRINLVHAGDFSLGYAFWAHYLEYPHDFLYLLPKEQKEYPYSNHVGLHAVTVQWNPNFLSSRRVSPFLLGGIGRYYGGSKTTRFQLLDPEQLIYGYFFQKDPEDEGTAILIGAGAVLFKYMTVYAGYVRLERTHLPSGNFLDLLVGFTI
jgi:hypothetical protein